MACSGYLSLMCSKTTQPLLYHINGEGTVTPKSQLHSGKLEDDASRAVSHWVLAYTYMHNLEAVSIEINTPHKFASSV